MVADVRRLLARDVERVRERGERAGVRLRGVERAGDDGRVEEVGPAEPRELVPLGPLRTVREQADAVAVAQTLDEGGHVSHRRHRVGDGLPVCGRERRGVRLSVPEQRGEDGLAAPRAAVFGVRVEIRLPRERGTAHLLRRRVEQGRAGAVDRDKRLVEVEADRVEIHTAPTARGDFSVRARRLGSL